MSTISINILIYENIFDQEKYTFPLYGSVSPSIYCKYKFENNKFLYEYPIVNASPARTRRQNSKIIMNKCSYNCGITDNPGEPDA